MQLVTPLGALVRGLAAGAVGSALQSAFFKLTASIAPQNPPGAFTPPEREQRNEQAVETVARRAAEDLAQGERLSPEDKKAAGQLVHYGFGAAWGGLYGLARESVPGISRPLGIAAYSTLVWAVSDNGILPAFKLAAPARQYPPKTHAYALAAHLAYGLGVWATYEVLRPQSVGAAAAALWAVNTRRRLGKLLPRQARPMTRSVVDGLARVYAQRPLVRAVAEGIH